MTSKDQEVIITVGCRREMVRDRKLSTAIRNSYKLYRRTQGMEADLQEVKGFISGRARDFMTGEPGSVTFRTGGLVCRVTPRHEAVIPEEHVAAVRRLLGSRFRRLVRVKTRYLGLRELMDKPAEGVRELVELRELAPRVVWQQVGK
jgi:hypothetical protein